MSIIVNIYYSSQNGNAKKFVEEMISRGIVDQIRKEDGNEQYEYFYPMDDSETILLIDRWKDQAALDQHHQSEMMKEIAALRKNIIYIWKFINIKKSIYEND